MHIADVVGELLVGRPHAEIAGELMGFEVDVVETHCLCQFGKEALLSDAQFREAPPGSVRMKNEK